MSPDIQQINGKTQEMHLDWLNADTWLTETENIQNHSYLINIFLRKKLDLTWLKNGTGKHTPQSILIGWLYSKECFDWLIYSIKTDSWLGLLLNAGYFDWLIDASPLANLSHKPSDWLMLHRPFDVKREDSSNGNLFSWNVQY